MPSRLAGILVPLFSMPSSRSWGIGEIGDIPVIARWLERAGQRLLQLLPINEMPPGETSPYSALSAMAIDPQFIAVERSRTSPRSAASRAGRDDSRAARAVRGSATIDYASVRELKQMALRRSFAHFRDTEWARGTRRAAAFRGYIDEQAWWLDGLRAVPGAARALRRAAVDRMARAASRPPPAALRSSRESSSPTTSCFRQYVAVGRGRPVEEHGATCGRRRALRRSAVHGQRRQRRRVGAAGRVSSRRVGRRAARCVQRDRPGLGASGVSLGRLRRARLRLAARSRTPQRGSVRRLSRRPSRRLLPDLFPAARRQGAGSSLRPTNRRRWRSASRCSQVFRDPGAEIIAEDLGVVPDFVRESLARHRYSRLQGAPVGAAVARRRDSRSRTRSTIRPSAVATSGTHDTEPMAMWWEGALAGRTGGGARDSVSAFGRSRGRGSRPRRWTPRACHTLSATRCSKRCTRRARTC